MASGFRSRGGGGGSTSYIGMIGMIIAFVRGQNWQFGIFQGFSEKN